MKESITKFDLEAAFKALDELDIPVAERGIKANKPALTEIFSKKTKLDALMEDYYDISSMTELESAGEAREAEVAKAKLARIEKIVDLDAESPEDLLPSYVGKFIMQCPQCMTLFYKNPEDVEASEEDPNTVNVSEVCQHCGNESGYTLIGKVGAATEEEQDELAGEQEIDVNSTEDGVEAEQVEEGEQTEDGTDDEEIEFNLDDLNLDDDDLSAEEAPEEESEKQEESHFNGGTGDPLVEGLFEETELDVSDSEFKELISSPEFSKPISDAAVRQMLNSNLEVPTEEQDEEPDTDTLTEGNLFDLGKAIGKKLGQAGKNIKNKLSNAIDKVTDNAKTREEKADWVLANALLDYNKAKINKNNELVPDEKNQRFHVFVVIGYSNKYSNGKIITMAPSFNNKELVVGKNGVQEKQHYKDADSVAKGWSMVQGNGPAFIYMAKNKDDAEAVFLCEYFKGELENDQLDKYFEVVKKHIKGAELMSAGGMSEEEAAEEVKDDFEENKAAAKASIDKLTKDAAGVEALTAIMASLAELQESSLERCVANSLKESYSNVAGFKLTECSYINNKFTIDGVIQFKSGNTRKTTYAFTEAMVTGNKVVLCNGINKKLGSDRYFTLTGQTDNNTLITESFIKIKK